MDYSQKLASRTKRMPMSAIRELFKVMNKPGMISLAGGAPAPEAFPVEVIKELSSKIIDKYGPATFQYGITEGFNPLRKALSEYVKIKKIDVSEDEVFISTGAQSAINAVAMIMINKGDKIAVESPTFLASLKTFNAYEPEYVSLEMDDEGIIPEIYEEILKNNDIKFTYIIPNFQNPTGKTLSLSRRKQIVEITKKYDAIILEDDPYFELRYIGNNLPSLQSLAPENVIHIGSLSKVFSPGMRLGYFVAPKEISKMMVSAIQGIEVHTNKFAQAIASEYINDGYLDKQLPKIKEIYSSRLNVMLEELKNNLSKNFVISKPEGGMFVWIQTPKDINIDEVYDKCIEANVAFVPGKYFFVNQDDGLNTIRLNFTNVSEEKIRSGVGEMCVIMNSL